MAPSRGFRLFSDTALSSRNNNVCQQCRIRLHSTTKPLYSGHNRWSKIKHDKGKADAVKNKQRSIFAQEIFTASKLGGGDPVLNTRLADLITKAKREGFPKASIDAAVARGQGKSASGAQLESVTVEGILPNNVAVIVECETDNKLRTLSDVRLIMKEAGGSATPAAYLFEKTGRVVYEAKEGVGADEALDAALEAGATDVEDNDDGRLIISCKPGDTKSVGETVAKALGLQIATSDILWEPNEDTKIGIADEKAGEELGNFVSQLQDRESSVQAVAMNVAQGKLDDGAWRELQDRLTV